MIDERVRRIAQELGIKPSQVSSVAKLLEESCTIPFIARYRKEATESLDEVKIAQIRDRLEQLAELDNRREAIIKSLEELKLLSDELKKSIFAAQTLALLEDIYLPYRPKRRTRAIIAREKGLEPFAKKLFSQEDFDPVKEGKNYVNLEKEVGSEIEAISGARDIIAEWINEDTKARNSLREMFSKEGIIFSKVKVGKEQEGSKFRDYFNWSEQVAKAPGYRILAMFRGETEKFLSLQIRPSEDLALGVLRSRFLIRKNLPSEQVSIALEDSYKRLLAPSLETEIRQEIKKKADNEAIWVFAKNLKGLLLAPPLGQKRVMAIDPGYRTGAKLVCLDAQGKLLHFETIFPTQSTEKLNEAEAVVKKLCTKFDIEAIAIGNGTAGRETEAFVRKIDLPKSVNIVMVSESGASIYSASKAAREEFPDHDVTVRGAVSIGRRLMDPLSELVKIDPKSIGVGQYQHDVDQNVLKRSLDDVVTSCVNGVGVEVNTASSELLTYVSGLGPNLAKNIVSLRNENGPFKKRTDLLKVHRLGPKAFEQAAGFLRIRGGENLLDSTAVHPECYSIVEKMAGDFGCSVKDLMMNETQRKKIDLLKYVIDGKVGLPTLTDVLDELGKPGRDPREKFEVFSFSEGVNSIDDLKAGMSLKGIVTNVTRFGAFVDIGVHQDGLIHVSQLSDRFVKDPTEIVKIQQKLTVTILEIDKERKRISLSLRPRKGHLS